MQIISKRPFVQLSSLRLITTAVVCATLCASTAQAQEGAALAPAEAPPVASVAAPVGVHFGQAGQWFLEGQTFWTLGGTFGGNASDLSLSWSSASGSSTIFNLNIQPVAGYFFTDVVFGRLGFDIGYNHGGSGSGADAFVLGIEPGVGIALPVAAKITFAPWIGLNFMYGHLSQNSASEDATKLNLEVHVPLVFEIVDHFGWTAGIYYAQGLVNHTSAGGVSTDGDKMGTVGITTGLIGYW